MKKELEMTAQQKKYVIGKLQDIRAKKCTELSKQTQEEVDKGYIDLLRRHVLTKTKPELQQLLLSFIVYGESYGRVSLESHQKASVDIEAQKVINTELYTGVSERAKEVEDKAKEKLNKAYDKAEMDIMLGANAEEVKAILTKFENETL